MKRAAIRHVLITGATGAIGGALALEYSAPGCLLTLQGRRADVLEMLAAQCREKGADVVTHCLDLADRPALRDWLSNLCEADTPDLAILAAGLNTNIGPEWRGEKLEDSEALVNINLLAVMNAVDSLLPHMRRRGKGQIALISSLAGYFGLPVTPSYCATKAAVRIYANSLRGWLAPEGIRINVIMPGYVSSPMCDAMPGPKPFQWHPEKAAGVIRRGLKSDRARISFPFPLNLGIWALSLLPYPIAMPIARWFGYGRG